MSTNETEVYDGPPDEGLAKSVGGVQDTGEPVEAVEDED